MISATPERMVCEDETKVKLSPNNLSDQPETLSNNLLQSFLKKIQRNFRIACLMLSDLTMAKATGLIFLLFNVALA